VLAAGFIHSMMSLQVPEVNDIYDFAFFFISALVLSSLSHMIGVTT
jgi:hypothetical protein